MMAFIGVRISWLMLARNMDFIWVASSAFLGLAQFLCHTFLVADVHQQPDQAARTAIRELEAIHRVERDVRLAICVLDRQLVTAAAPFAEHGCVLVVKLATVRFRQVIQLQNGFALEQLRRWCQTRARRPCCS